LPNIELFKKWTSFGVATLGTAGSVFPKYIIPVSYCINSYLFVDLFFAKRDMALHHLLILSLFSTNYIYDISEEYKMYLISQIIRFEYSTIIYGGGPLVLHYLSSHSSPKIQTLIPKIKTILHIGFALAFFKYRIYDFAGNVILNASVYSIEKASSVAALIHVIATVWTFYALNLYWFHLILEKLGSIKSK